MLDEIGGALDPARVHFLCRIPYDQLIALLRVSRAHVYLTYPFVLSWSLLEAMALGCSVVASDVAPVREVITARQNAELVPFFDNDALVQKTIELLSSPERFAAARRNAAATIRNGYGFERNSLPLFLELIAELSPDVGRLISSESSTATDICPSLLETVDA
jgi:glycosyltransferase involved in cell wall biosynthesis